MDTTCLRSTRRWCYLRSLFVACCGQASNGAHSSCTWFPELRVTINRDLLEWPGMFENREDDIHVIEKWDVKKRVDSMLRQFCPRLGCIQPACPSHCTYFVTHPAILRLLPIAHDHEWNREVKPTLNNDSLRQRIKKNCNNMCFILEGDEFIVSAAVSQR